MKSMLVFATVLLSTGSAFAQSYQITPAKTIEVVAPADKLTIFDIYQENTGAAPINIGWRKVAIKLPAGWDYSMCELGRCYGGIPDSSQMDSVPPSEKAFLGLNIIPNGIAGTGQVQCYVFDARYPEKRDTLTWIIKSASASVQIAGSAKPVTIEPNPTHATSRVDFGLQFTGELFLYNMAGNQLQKLMIESASHVNLDLSNISAGAYTLVGMRNNKQVFSLRLVKE